MKTLAIIPAREGSTGILNKNLIDLGDQRLIDYTFEAAARSELIDHVYFASDYVDDIMPVRPIKRLKGFNWIDLPYVLTTGDVQVDEAVLYSLRELNWEYDNALLDHFDTVIILQPTSPFRTAEHIDEALTLYREVNSVKKPFEDKDIVFSVWEPGWTYDVETSGYVVSWGADPRIRQGRREEDSTGYATENGAIYIIDLKRYFKNKSFRAHRMIPYYMDKVSSIEIDDPIDLAMAEAVLAYESNS